MIAALIDNGSSTLKEGSIYNRREAWGRQVQLSPGLAGDFRSPSQFQGTGPAWIPWTTLGYVEKVRPQFLSLRHLFGPPDFSVNE
jgi:hypothetical protein